MSNKNFYSSKFINLRLFDEGGIDASSADNKSVADGSLAKNKNPLANVHYGKTLKEEAEHKNSASDTTESEDLDAEFDELIKGKYKTQFHNSKHTWREIK